MSIFRQSEENPFKIEHYITYFYNIVWHSASCPMLAMAIVVLNSVSNRNEDASSFSAIVIIVLSFVSLLTERWFGNVKQCVQRFSIFELNAADLLYWIRCILVNEKDEIQ